MTQAMKQPPPGQGRGKRAVASGKAAIAGFANITHQDLGGGMGIYRANHKDTGKEIGWIRYLVLLDKPDIVKILGTYVDPSWRGRKVGTALGERVHLDYPGYFLDLGDKGETVEAKGFWEFQKGNQPDWVDTVSNDGARERVAKENQGKES